MYDSKKFINIFVNIYYFILVFAGRYLPHLHSMEKIHRAKLKKLNTFDESSCFFDAEAELETEEENFFFDFVENLKIPKPNRDQCYKTFLRLQFTNVCNKLDCISSLFQCLLVMPGAYH
jgi:hypothetical protein